MKIHSIFFQQDNSRKFSDMCFNWTKDKTVEQCLSYVVGVFLFRFFFLGVGRGGELGGVMVVQKDLFHKVYLKL